MSELPRLLLCAFDVIPGPSGLSRRVTEYVKGLGDHFHVVVLSAKTPEHSHIERYHGARLLRVPVGMGDLQTRLSAFDRAVRRQLDSEEYAAAHFFDPFGGYALCELRPKHRLPLVYEAQSFPSVELRDTHPALESDRRFGARVRRQELFCLMNADVVITGSEHSAAYVRGLGVGQERLRVLRAPVDMEAYRPEQLGTPDGPGLRLLYLGSQVGYQGLPTLLRAVYLATRRVNVRLTLAGPRHPDWQPKLEDLVAELELSERVTLLPPVPHDALPALLADCDAGVLPLEDVERNRVQGAPLAKVSEYFAAGRPVIASDLPLTRELLPDGPTLFHPPGDASELAEQLVELARDPELRAELGRSARAFARERLDSAFIRAQLIAVYDELLGKVPRERLLGTLAPRESSEPTATAVPLVSAPTVSNDVGENPGTDPAAAPAEPPLPAPTPAAAPPSQSAARDAAATGAAPASSPTSPAPPRPRPGELRPARKSSPRVDRVPPPSATDTELTDPTAAGTSLLQPAAGPAAAREGTGPTATPGVGRPGQPALPPPATVLPPLRLAAPAAPAAEPPAAPRAARRAATAPAAPSPSTGDVPTAPVDEPRGPPPPSLLPSPRARLRTAPPRPAASPPAPAAAPEPPAVARDGDWEGAPEKTLVGFGPSAAEPVPPDAPEEARTVATPTPEDADDELREVASDEVELSEDAALLAAPSGEQEVVPTSTLDPWYAQLAHGYCPPSTAARFARHTPPTNFPGREEPAGELKPEQ